jgi:hypothetical protein
MDIWMDERDLSLSDKLLLSMHNMCVVKPEIAKSGDELSKSISLAVEYVLGLLKNNEEHGYVKSYTDSTGKKRFYLTSLGIIKVCSSFT